MTSDTPESQPALKETVHADARTARGQIRKDFTGFTGKVSREHELWVIHRSK